MARELIVLFIQLIAVGAAVALVRYLVRAIPIEAPLGRIIDIGAMVIGSLVAILLLLNFANVIVLY